MKRLEGLARFLEHKYESAARTLRTALDDHVAVGEFHLKLHGWLAARRFVVIREQAIEDRDSVGRRLVDVPGYAFRVLVTGSAEAPEEIWRDWVQTVSV